MKQDEMSDEAQTKPGFAWARRLLFGIVLALLLVNLVSLVRSWAPLRPSVPRGQPAPEFSLPLLGGGVARLADYRGQAVVLDFFAPWCPPCRAELPTLDRLHRRYGDQVKFLAIDTDGDGARGAASAFAQETGLTLPIAFDDGATASAYRVSSIPVVVVLDPRGRVARVFHGNQDESDLARAIDAAR